MKAFSRLLESLYYEPSTLGKTRLLLDYLRTTPDPDRGYAVAIIAGDLSLPNFRRAMVLELIRARVDPTLLTLSHDYVGELSETVAHLWPAPESEQGDLPPLAEVVEALRHTPKAQLPDYVAGLLDRMTSPERWALLKIGAGALRIGVSARLLKQVLAKFGDQPVERIESLWHGIDPPYQPLFDWLEGRKAEPVVSERLTFTPVMLAHPLEVRDHALITPDTYAAEWKYDGIRVQIVHSGIGRALFTRTGDDISGSFPDVLAHLNFHAVLDGELLVQRGEETGTFNDLQQRLGRKAPSAKYMADYPAAIVAYDVLFLEGEDVRACPYDQRRALLQAALERHHPDGIRLSPQLPYGDFAELEALRASVDNASVIEGLMLKRRDSAYVAGRPTGPWYKWKINPKLVDAVLMYAQRGSGKRSSFYSDFTFGLWSGNQLLPIGKAYFGFTDAELRELDKWVRHNTLNSFGPVREVKKELVFEVAFDAVNRSKRHKSGFALRFPRISRIRWDKPAQEADHLSVLEPLAGTG
ncbi:MAG: cisplatin damage response ATP-dependent DNA ligase [Asticcacaulis sp.]|uniref:cisplatin damage response ATP-dependent DNA ligase n=1 Tax=Asticcacaulis sp. TaxID=1872648 RepID=UPI0025BBA23D|nr:cisplatin damage response ATP-dependent DNA ligase [Asticcacaulis sp.]MCA1935803.1 cisplatin damage response ATP-dependent DNA ligase [Asticcacaulis sp.]